MHMCIYILHMCVMYVYMCVYIYIYAYISIYIYIYRYIEDHGAALLHEELVVRRRELAPVLDDA